MPRETCVAAGALLDRVLADPPPWADVPIQGMADAVVERIELFLRHKAWTNRGSVNVFRILGTQRPDYCGLSWVEFLKRGKQMEHNLHLYRENPGYYHRTAVKEPTMYYLTMDGGLSYYIAEDGNHRSGIARFDAWYCGECLLHGVTVTDLRPDAELARLYGKLIDHLAALRARSSRYGSVVVEPVTECMTREDGPGWMIETYQPALKVTGWWGGVRQLEHREAMELKKDWCARRARCGLAAAPLALPAVRDGADARRRAQSNRAGRTPTSVEARLTWPAPRVPKDPGHGPSSDTARGHEARARPQGLEETLNPVYNTASLRMQEVSMTVRLNITMEKEVYVRLKQAVPPKKLSAFITEAVRAKLPPDRKTLDAAYRAARKEQWRKTLSDEWGRTETEGWPT